LLLSGWLLMFPPTDGQKVLIDEDIRKWEHVAAFDTARECQDMRLGGMEWHKRQGEEIGKSSDAWRRWNDLEKQRAVASRCIPADHIYPPKKPGN
jgi:hypothetical protein